MLNFIVGLVIGFVAGVLVGRANKKHVEQIVTDLKDKIQKKN